MDGECIHEMVLGTCGVCAEFSTRSRGSAAPTVPGTFRRGVPSGDLADRQYTEPRAMAARYPGFCRECRHEISVGESISPNNYDEWVHTECL